MSDSLTQNQRGSLVSEKDLIFVISLPRSGSTLLQHILASHSEIATTAEPWIMFPGALALRDRGLRGDYNAQIGKIALQEFLAQLDQGEQAYYDALQRMALHLYGEAMAHQKKSRFVDKTSRYYQIFPELVRTFPAAKYIFLLRNPLGMLSSFLSHMVFGDLRRLSEPGIRHDLLDGYRLMIEGIRYFGDDAVVIHYEDLVADPSDQIKSLCKQVDIEFEPMMLNYAAGVGVLEGKLVDPKSIYKHKTPVPDYADQWRSKLESRQNRTIAKGFLDHLGPTLLDELGYDHQELMRFVSSLGGSGFVDVKWSDLLTPGQGRSVVQKMRMERANPSENPGLGKSAFTTGKKMVKYLTRLTGLTGQTGDGSEVSSEYTICELDQLSQSTNIDGWLDENVSRKQMKAYRPLLKQMYEGSPRQDFVTAARALELTGRLNGSFLEIGCGNGYYSEILKHLTRGNFQYHGVDYSEPMLRSGRENYPDHSFSYADACDLPFADDSFDVSWSGTILMHVLDYKSAVRESVRVSNRWIVFHSTPLVIGGKTVYMRKKAYGGVVPEVLIAKQEFEQLLRSINVRIRHILPSLPYEIPISIQGAIQTLTYVCEKGITA